MSIEEYYIDVHRRVLIVKMKDDGVVVIVDLLPCTTEFVNHNHITHIVNVNGIEILVKSIDLDDFTYFNRAEIEILCIQSRKSCQYLSLRLYTSYQSLNQFRNKLNEILQKIIDGIEARCK